MIRILSLFSILALASCEQENPSPTETATNESAKRMENQKDDLADFMADFKTSMDLKYGDLKAVPELEDIGLLRIEGTHVFNYNFDLTLHQEDHLEPVKKELHRLITLHQVETINLNIRPRFEVPRSRNSEYLGSWCLAKDGTFTKSRNRVGGTDATQRVLDRINKRPK